MTQLPVVSHKLHTCAVHETSLNETRQKRSEMHLIALIIARSMMWEQSFDFLDCVLSENCIVFPADYFAQGVRPGWDHNVGKLWFFFFVLFIASLLFRIYKNVPLFCVGGLAVLSAGFSQFARAKLPLRFLLEIIILRNCFDSHKLSTRIMCF